MFINYEKIFSTSTFSISYCFSRLHAESKENQGTG